MTLRQFVVPSDEEWVDALGFEPDEVVGEVAVGRVRWISDNEELNLTYDIPGNSIRCIWRRDETVLLDMFREGARQLSVGSGLGEVQVVIIFETDGLRGKLTIRLAPGIQIHDEVLFV